MPQFDKITFFNQIFWLIIAFSTFYFLILKSLLPVLAISLKTRKKLISVVFLGNSTGAEFSSRKPYSKNLQVFLKTYKTLFSFIFQKKVNVLEDFKPKMLKSTFFSA